jgi:hypothetical protein
MKAAWFPAMNGTGSRHRVFPGLSPAASHGEALLRPTEATGFIDAIYG